MEGRVTHGPANAVHRRPPPRHGGVRLGIVPEFIEPGQPAQNGRHERMHRTLKAETTRPAGRRPSGSDRYRVRVRVSLTMRPRSNITTEPRHLE